VLSDQLLLTSRHSLGLAVTAATLIFWSLLPPAVLWLHRCGHLHSLRVDSRRKRQLADESTTDSGLQGPTLRNILVVLVAVLVFCWSLLVSVMCVFCCRRQAFNPLGCPWEFWFSTGHRSAMHRHPRESSVPVSVGEDALHLTPRQGGVGEGHVV